MIRSFGNRLTEALFHGRPGRETRSFPPDLKKVTLRKLDMVNTAHVLEDLRVPPQNRLEALTRDLKGYHSIRVNDQWRIVFRWEGSDAHEVAVVDYH